MIPHYSGISCDTFVKRALGQIGANIISITEYFMTRNTFLLLKELFSQLRIARAHENSLGRFIVRGGETVTIEGPDVDERVVVLEFANLDQAVACFSSPAYEEARKFRLGAAEMRLFAVEGFDPTGVNRSEET